MTEETQPTDKPKKRKPHLIKTNFKFCIDQVVISADCGLPSEEKCKLRAPEFVGKPYLSGKMMVVDIRDHADRMWSLVAPTRSSLRQKLRYFKGLTKEVIEAALEGLPRKEIPVLGWQKHKKLVCVKCQVPARINPADHEQFRCATCGTAGPSGELFAPKSAVAAKPKDKSAESKPEAKKEKPKESKKMGDSKPIEGKSLAERMAARKVARDGSK